LTDRELITIEQAAEILQVSRRSIYNWLALGKVEGIRTPGGCVRLYRDSLFKEIGEFKLNGRNKESK
jgi:excisionase family DNA binding protein